MCPTDGPMARGARGDITGNSLDRPFFRSQMTEWQRLVGLSRAFAASVRRLPIDGRRRRRVHHVRRRLLHVRSAEWMTLFGIGSPANRFRAAPSECHPPTTTFSAGTYKNLRHASHESGAELSFAASLCTFARAFRWCKGRQANRSSKLCHPATLGACERSFAHAAQLRVLRAEPRNRWLSATSG